MGCITEPQVTKGGDVSRWEAEGATMVTVVTMVHQVRNQNTYLRHQKKLEPLVFYGPRNSLEAKPNVLQAFCEHFVNMLELDAAVLTIFATLWSSNLSFSMVGFKLV